MTTAFDMMTLRAADAMHKKMPPSLSFGERQKAASATGRDNARAERLEAEKRPEKPENNASRLHEPEQSQKQAQRQSESKNDDFKAALMNSIEPGTEDSAFNIKAGSFLAENFARKQALSQSNEQNGSSLVAINFEASLFAQTEFQASPTTIQAMDQESLMADPAFMAALEQQFADMGIEFESSADFASFLSQDVIIASPEKIATQNLIEKNSLILSQSLTHALEKKPMAQDTQAMPEMIYDWQKSVNGDISSGNGFSNASLNGSSLGAFLMGQNNAAIMTANQLQNTISTTQANNLNAALSGTQGMISLDMNADFLGDFDGEFNDESGRSLSFDPLASLKAKAAGQNGYTAQSFASFMTQTGRASVPSHQLNHPITNQVHLAMQKAAEGQVEKMTLQLKPAELGKIDVELKFGEDGIVQARVSAERQETLDILKQDAKSLEELLKESGLDMGENSLEFDLRQKTTFDRYDRDDPFGKSGSDEFDALIKGDKPSEQEEQLHLAAEAILSADRVNIIV